MRNMTNNVTEITFTSVAESQGPKIAVLVLQTLSLTLHFIVQYIIKRKRLNDNQYYLMRVLSATDSLCILVSYIIIIRDLSQYSMSRDVAVFLSLLIVIGFTFSLIVTLIIAIDRLIAVKYCLHYHSIVTRTRIHLVLLISGALNAAFLSCLFYVWRVTNTGVNKLFFKNDGVIIYQTIIRAFSCIALIIIGQ